MLFCPQIPAELAELEPLFHQLKLCLKCGKNLNYNDHHCMVREKLEKFLCQEHSINIRFCCHNPNIPNVKSQVCKLTASSECLQGDSILGLEKVPVSGTSILTLFDSGSSHQFPDKSCRNLCQNVKKIKVKLSAIDASKFVWIESGT